MQHTIRHQNRSIKYTKLSTIHARYCPPSLFNYLLERERKTLILKYLELTLITNKIVSIFNKYDLKRPVYVSWGMPRMGVVILAS
jgi:hypothetical protein